VSSVASFEALNSKIEKEPNIRNRVKHLVLLLEGTSAKKQLQTFLPILPNLETFYSHVNAADLSFEEVPGQLWPKNIKKIYEVSSNVITHQLLSCNSLPQLTNLCIWSVSDEIVPLLKNVPQLKRLNLGEIKITFDDINTINQSLPQLQYIKFEDISFDNEQHYSVKPAISVTDCVFESLDGIDANGRIALLNYARQTYPNLNKFALRIYNGWIHEGDLITLIDDGWQPFFRAFGPKLESLKAGEEEYDIYFFDALDKSACQIRNLNIHCIDGLFNGIKNTEQISYIQTLHVYCDLQEDFVFIRDLVVLKELVVDAFYISYDDDFPQNQILFNEIIENAPPTLKSLSFELINHMIVEYKENSVPVNIEHLSFHTTVLPWNIDRLILMNFPSLRSLEINDCKVYGQIFNLITANLSCFTLRSISTNLHAILVLTLGNNEK
jgi:hypothetical protein